MPQHASPEATGCHPGSREVTPDRPEPAAASARAQLHGLERYAPVGDAAAPLLRDRVELRTDVSGVRGIRVAGHSVDGLCGNGPADAASTVT
ncbi:hypothetical protein [Microbacterium lemovicicum]|uniref:hypothetical protein n=1 Tax=Microbacterium lemovicicum TaxID=1072463 RepID=UPI000F8D39A7|nr:hypothetical protein [Microbacterium lemovicicum]